MKLNLPILAAALAFAAPGVFATDSASTNIQSSPLVAAAIDDNSDRVLDAAEIAKAAEQLLMLDLNGDGAISRSEMFGFTGLKWAKGGRTVRQGAKPTLEKQETAQVD